MDYRTGAIISSAFSTFTCCALFALYWVSARQWMRKPIRRFCVAGFGFSIGGVVGTLWLLALA